MKQLPRGSQAYETARKDAVWNARTPARFPELIVKPTTADEVVEAVTLANARSMRVSVRSGGHSWVGAQLRKDGMLLDLSQLNTVTLDAPHRVAVVGPAVTGSELEAALRPEGLAFPVGHSPTVAVGGYLLAGGVGWNSGAWGPACLSVSAIDVVTPTGELISADDDTHPELLWAARGAGPAFPGIVTRFHLRLHVLPRAITSSTMLFALAELPDLAEWVADAVPGLLSTVELAMRVGPLPDTDGAIGVRLSATAFSDSRRQAEAALAAVHGYPGAGRALQADLMAPSSLAALHRFVGGLFPTGHRYAAEAIWSDSDPTQLLTMLASLVEEAPSPRSFATVAILPAAAEGDGQPATALTRPGHTFIGAYAIWDEERADEANVAWHDRMKRELEAVTAGYYVGETDVLDPRRARGSFTEANWARLQRLRDELDPAGVLHGLPTG